MHVTKRPARRQVLSWLAVLLTFALIVAACGGGGDDDNGGGSGGGGNGDEGTPQEGGKVIYSLEGKTTQFCIPRAQFAISGIVVVEAIYDTLTRPTTEPNVYAPYLAKSVTPNADYTEWTIVIRDNIKFHNGEALTADVVKQNIDAWRKGLLLGFVYSNIKDTAVTAPNTVVVTTTVPWVAFPAFLWVTGRSAIAAPAQLNDDATCDSNMIGTGPFKLKSFDPTTGDVSTEKNDSYWRKDSEGRQLPYLDQLDFKPQEESSQRVSGLQGGQFDMINSTGGIDLDAVRALGDSVNIVLEPEGRQEVAHGLPNVTRPPLDDYDARKAVILATDRDALNEIANKGISRIANGVFDTRVMGYVPNNNFAKQDIAEAKKLVAKVKAKNGGKFEFALQSTYDQQTQALAQEVKRQMAQVGITVNLPKPVDQATIISQAIGGSIDSFLWRQYPGQDPDTMFVWFRGGSVVNFNHIDDPVMNEALDKGRSEPDPAKRKEYYETFNKRMSDQAYNFWNWYSQWFVATQNNVHGVVGPNLPDESGAPGDQKPVDILAGYHQLLGIWVDQ